MLNSSITRKQKHKPFTADAADNIHQSGNFELVKRELSGILAGNILKFWYPQVLDHESGGYRLSCDIHGIWSHSSRKSLIGQTRTLWFFSRISSSGFAEVKYRDAADHGYSFLNNFWNYDYGGYYWEIDAGTRKATRAGKHLCAQSFALSALAEYALAPKSPDATERSSTLFELIDQHSHAPVYGGYTECLDEYWIELDQDETPYLGLSSLYKTFNTHIHLLEAITAYYRTTKDPQAEVRLHELLHISRIR